MDSLAGSAAGAERKEPEVQAARNPAPAFQKFLKRRGRIAGRLDLRFLPLRSGGGARKRIHGGVFPDITKPSSGISREKQRILAFARVTYNHHFIKGVF